VAWVICSALASVAITFSNRCASSSDSWPEPQPASQASARPGARSARQSTRTGG